MSEVDRTGAPDRSARPRFSIVVPTYQRRDLVVAGVRALTSQSFDGPFEVVVCVDGSTDGTAEALRGLDVPFPLRVLEQENSGAAAARNAGAVRARGEIVLFLDDDMEADPQLLAEHDRLHREGADAVLGHMPLHPGSRATVISAAVGEWADERLGRLSRPGAELTLHDLLTGQLSVSATVFRATGGFDSVFTRGGAFGNEDVDFGHRLLRGGYDIRFAPGAVSWQRYSVTAQQHLRQWRQAGRADVLFTRKYPEEGLRIFELNGLHERFAVRVARPLSRAPLWPALTWPVRALARRVGDRPGRLAWSVFIRARMLEYWRGVSEAGGLPQADAALRVLAYHAVADLSGRGALEPYGVPVEQLADQLRTLEARGFNMIRPEEFAAFAEGRAGLPRRAVLITFDDCYRDLLDAVPILEARSAGALAFAVSGLVGATNEWDRHHGGGPLPLLDADGLRRLREHGIEVGAHSRTHRLLPELPDGAVEEEVAGSVADLQALGLGPVRHFAYPYGEHDERVRAAARATGVRCAFAIDPGVMDSRTDRLRIPRVEIVRADSGARFLAKVVLARQLGWVAPRTRRATTLGLQVTLGGRRRLRWGVDTVSGALRSRRRIGAAADEPAQPEDGAPPGVRQTKG